MWQALHIRRFASKPVSHGVAASSPHPRNSDSASDLRRFYEDLTVPRHSRSKSHQPTAAPPMISPTETRNMVPACLPTKAGNMSPSTSTDTRPMALSSPNDTRGMVPSPLTSNPTTGLTPFTPATQPAQQAHHVATVGDRGAGGVVNGDTGAETSLSRSGSIGRMIHRVKSQRGRKSSGSYAAIPEIKEPSPSPYDDGEGYHGGDLFTPSYNMNTDTGSAAQASHYKRPAQVTEHSLDKGLAQVTERLLAPSPALGAAPPVAEKALKTKKSFRERLRSLAGDRKEPQPLPIELKQRRASYVPTHAASDFMKMGSVSRQGGQGRMSVSRSSHPDNLRADTLETLPAEPTESQDFSARRMSKRPSPPISPLWPLDENESVDASTEGRSSASRPSFSQPSFSERILRASIAEQGAGSRDSHSSQPSSHTEYHEELSAIKETDSLPSASPSSDAVLPPTPASGPLISFAHASDVPLPSSPTTEAHMPTSTAVDALAPSSPAPETLMPPTPVPEMQHPDPVRTERTPAQPSEYEQFVAEAANKEREYREQMMQSITRRASLVHAVPYHHNLAPPEPERVQAMRNRHSMILANYTVHASNGPAGGVEQSTPRTLAPTRRHSAYLGGEARKNSARHKRNGGGSHGSHLGAMNEETEEASYSRPKHRRQPSWAPSHGSREMGGEDSGYTTASSSRRVSAAAPLLAAEHGGRRESAAAGAEREPRTLRAQPSIIKKKVGDYFRPARPLSRYEEPEYLPGLPQTALKSAKRRESVW